MSVSAGRGDSGFAAIPFQLFDIGGDRVYRSLRYLHTERGDHVSDIKSNLKARSPLDQAIKQSVRSRVRSVLMTASMAAIGLMPAALSHGIGSESQRPLAIVIIGGLVGATFFTLFVFPLMVETFYRRMLYDKDGKLLQRKL